MKDVEERVRQEEKVIHRSRCAVTEVQARLKALGIYQAVPDGPGRFKTVNLDPAQRRNFLVFLSELEELVKTLETLKGDIAHNIEMANRNMNATAMYRRAGMSVKKVARQGRH